MLYPPVCLSDSADCRRAFFRSYYSKIFSSTDNGKSTDSGMYTASSLYRFDLTLYLRVAVSPLVLVRRRTLAFAFLHTYVYIANFSAISRMSRLYPRCLAIVGGKSIQSRGPQLASTSNIHPQRAGVAIL